LNKSQFGNQTILYVSLQHAHITTEKNKTTCTVYQFAVFGGQQWLVDGAALFTPAGYAALTIRPP
jgi:hypothetical protein